MIPRTAIRFYLLALCGSAVLTAGLAWYRHIATARELVDLATLVAIGLAFVAFPLLGPGKYSESYRLEEDPSGTESPHTLSNRARGALALAAAGSWLGLTIAFDLSTR
ncbi:hypothetical protein [Inhella proteolytica]|uniref:Uncharacterized protein n=1 Tax=Inhella proteolytica TaxID=2795029 RepID=A0A931NCD2_9BURK|nr:hypothetical protein [Inhella proteolytica]MBH9575447.1 hypothetical protein [Inhella proteolytica]